MIATLIAALVVSLGVGDDMTRKQQQRQQAQFLAQVQQVLDFYAGKPGVRASFDLRDGKLGTTGLAGSNVVQLAPQLEAPLQALFANPRAARAPYDSAEALTTLIHEALHTRGLNQGGARQPSGFYSWDDEWQAKQLAASLVPDAMKRFFGVDPDSPLGRKYETAGRGQGFTSKLGAPEDPAGRAVWGARESRW